MNDPFPPDGTYESDASSGRRLWWWLSLFVSAAFLLVIVGAIIGYAYLSVFGGPPVANTTSGGTNIGVSGAISSYTVDMNAGTIAPNEVNVGWTIGDAIHDGVVPEELVITMDGEQVKQMEYASRSWPVRIASIDTADANDNGRIRVAFIAIDDDNNVLTRSAFTINYDEEANR